ncbi:vacuolar aminopeptidase [Metschnikowia bicuspidata]|uniref:Vacuolar aminopeptidase n=1 Tax=Metschnikowia bicuspidata TaxID=27322 RepID=A0A4P9ZGJ3_9ASCO|nr:vacuolar aminopeptidase [Metschnikowia bicuspidata]
MPLDSFSATLVKAIQDLDGKLLLRVQNTPIHSSGYSDSYFDDHAAFYINFTYTNPTIYHVVEHFSKQLKNVGFKYVAEKDSWAGLKPGKYYTHRNGSALAAFVVGPDWTPARGIGFVGSHVDSLSVALKPTSAKQKVDGYDLLGVAPYAGTLGSVWWDRDLGIGGRLLVRGADGKVRKVLADLTPHPIARIPTLAPHFGEPAVGPFNLETQAVPVIGFSGDAPEPVPTAAEKKAPLYGRHPLKLLRYVASLADVKVEDILEWDLQFYDVQKGTRGGLDNEFVFAPRVDDRACSYAAIASLIESVSADFIPSDAFSVVGLFDNEEIGSATRVGIKGQLFESVVSRVVGSKHFNPHGADIDEKLKMVYANTIILSADVNHLVNPNFTDVYLEHHKPVPNKGMTIALDPNGHMATDAVGLALVEELARVNGDELQYFQIRNDSRSGSTIGPSVSLQTGARTIDLGIPQLSMHSIRAALGARDIGLGVKFFNGFFANWRKIYDNYGDL